MNAQQILFSAPMVNALLAGRKKATRRVVKGAIDRNFGCAMAPSEIAAEVNDRDFTNCPYGAPGDLLWVRETWQYADWTEDGEPFIRYRADDERRLITTSPEEWGEKLSDIWANLSEPENYLIDGRAADRRWRPSIHMPRWASRLTLRITDVRVQRLQEISEEDAIAEGVEGAFVEDGRYWRNYALSDEEAACSPMLVSPIHSFKSLWESIYGPESWHDDPWVWALTFEAIKANVDAVIAGAAP